MVAKSKSHLQTPFGAQTLGVLLLPQTLATRFFFPQYGLFPMIQLGVFRFVLGSFPLHSINTPCFSHSGSSRMRIHLCMAKPFPNLHPSPFQPPHVQKGQVGPKLCLSHTFTRVLGTHWKIQVQGAVSSWSPVQDSWIQLSLENHPHLSQGSHPYSQGATPPLLKVLSDVSSHLPEVLHQSPAFLIPSFQPFSLAGTSLSFHSKTQAIPWSIPRSWLGCRERHLLGSAAGNIPAQGIPVHPPRRKTTAHRRTTAPRGSPIYGFPSDRDSDPTPFPRCPRPRGQTWPSQTPG